MPTLHVIVKGKVQGVFYRASAKKKADEFGITGWVQNTPDGCVEIVASGASLALEQFVEWCGEGPALASVTDVALTIEEEQAFEEFEVRR